ncbi:MAG: YbjN domain-containing protein [Myxococcota bacterium]
MADEAPDAFPLTLESVEAWCERMGLVCGRTEDGGQVVIPRPGEGAIPIRIIDRPDRQMTTFGMVMPWEVPEDRMDAVSRAVADANASMFMGAWVLNTDSGQLYYRVTVPAGPVLYTDEGLKHVVELLVGTALHSHDELRGIAVG